MLQILNLKLTCHAEQHQVGQLEQIRGGGVRDPATVVNIQLGERLSRHHYYYHHYDHSPPGYQHFTCRSH